MLLVKAMAQAGAEPDEIRPHVEEVRRLAPDTPVAETAEQWLQDNPVSGS